MRPLTDSDAYARNWERIFNGKNEETVEETSQSRSETQRTQSSEVGIQTAKARTTEN